MDDPKYDDSGRPGTAALSAGRRYTVSIHGLVYGFNVDQLPRRKDAPGAMVGCYLNQYAFVKAFLRSLFAG